MKKKVAKKANTKKADERGEFTCKSCGKGSSGCGGMFYFLGFIGAFVHYLASTIGFWAGVGGFFKALVWPAFLVFELLKFLGA